MKSGVVFLSKGMGQSVLVALRDISISTDRLMSSLLVNNESRRFLLKYTAKLGLVYESKDLLGFFQWAQKSDWQRVPEEVNWLLKSFRDSIGEMGSRPVACNRDSGRP
jgi:hypothetical protein